MDGSMIALYPPMDLAEQLAVDGGLPPEKIHCTIAYTGPAVDIDQDTLRAVAATLTGRPPIQASISGHARFTGGDQDVIVALVDGPGIEDLRRDTLDALAAHGIEVPRAHGHTAHMTLLYLDPDAESPIDRIAATPVLFATVNAVHAGDRTGYTLVGETAIGIREAARQAYATGWASVPDAPMTAEVRAGCIAAVTWATENARRPDVLEATIKIGQLEGAWALIYQRREKREQQHQAAVLAAWAKLLKLIALDELVARFHAQAPTLPDQTPQAIHMQALAVARQAFIGINTADPAYGQLLDSITSALADAQAEGAAAGHAIRGRAADMPAAYDDARARISDLTTWGQAPPVAGQIMSGAASTLARILAAGYTAKLTLTGLYATVRDALTGSDARPVTAYLDVAMGQAWNSGAVSVYAADGVTMVNYWTAGGSKVCRACQDAESGSPYAIADAPAPPLHPNCRCSLAPVDADVPGVPPPSASSADAEEQ
ncbi:2'-5' RNA ligase family protein [Streptacidiphilus sp. EB129]|uniref:2'-5' RNA ligase family protein n=1 Tax=Streptacidiphilus sp. EB129 TaxID=3156262 RepID=UPI00351349A9